MIIYDPFCPLCGAEMQVRRNKDTQENFWGCSNYPECKGTRPIETEESPVEDPKQNTLPSDRYRNADRKRWRQ